MNILTDITGIILVGGKSRRMGRDKAFLPVDDRPLVAPVIDLFRASFSRVVLVGDRQERFADLGVPVVSDIYPGSALGGLYTGLAHAETRYTFVASCDLPFPQQGVLRYLCSLRSGFDVVLPTSTAGLEPLFALYSRTCLVPMRRNLEMGKFNIRGFFQDVRVKEVASRDLERIDPTGSCFVNINTPQEYGRILRCESESQLHQSNAGLSA